MYTIDTLIARLSDLKNTAKLGGKTPVAVGGSACMEPTAIIELIAATPIAGTCGTRWSYTIASTVELLRIM